MIDALNFLRTENLTTLSVVVRLVLAVLCGGIIGIERERKRRPAGFRTHILICLGSAITTLTSQYFVFELGLYTDLTRLGAQVIAGIGFIGAGAIIVTRHRQVKGLTTAAGLWVTAIVGLCCGAGFYEGVILTTLIILVAELLFSRLEYFIISHARTSTIYVEYTQNELLSKIIETIKQTGAYIIELEISKSSVSGKHSTVTFSIKSSRKVSCQALIPIVAKIDGVISVEEL